MSITMTLSGEREAELKVISSRLHMTPQQLARHYIDKGIEEAHAIRNKYWLDKLQIAKLIGDNQEGIKKNASIQDSGPGSIGI